MLSIPNDSKDTPFTVYSSLALTTAQLITKKNVKWAIGVTAAAAFTALYYSFLRDTLMDYNAKMAQLQNSIKCMHEPESSSMPGCNQRVYCIEEDPGFKKFYGFYLDSSACVNDKKNSMFDLSKENMENDVNKYLNTTIYAKQLFDKLYFKLLV